MSFSRQMSRLEEEKIVSVTRVRTEPFESFEQRFSDEARRGSFDLVYVSQVFFDSAFVIDRAFVAAAAVDCTGRLVVANYVAGGRGVCHGPAG